MRFDVFMPNSTKSFLGLTNIIFRVEANPMLKIVAGKYRSRQIEVPESVTVPTKNRAREAMLSSLGNQIQGANVLDLFAGSGALGIETLSRGAAHCDFVEADSKAAQVLTENLKKLKVIRHKKKREDFVLSFLFY